MFEIFNSLMRHIRLEKNKAIECDIIEEIQRKFQTDRKPMLINTKLTTGKLLTDLEARQGGYNFPK